MNEINLVLFNKIFRERGKKGERQGEKQQCERETSIWCLSLAPNLGPGPEPRCMP